MASHRLSKINVCEWCKVEFHPWATHPDQRFHDQSCRTKFTNCQRYSDWVARFWELVKVDPMTGCWNWTGYTVGRGDLRYGVLGRKGRYVKATHIAWQIAQNGEVPDGLQLRHVVCRNTRCVNVGHLAIGTPKDNHDDMLRDGTRASFAGTNNGRARFNDDEVMELRREFSDTNVSALVMAAREHVTPTTIWNLLSGATWAHLPTVNYEEAKHRRAVERGRYHLKNRK